MVEGILATLISPTIILFTTSPRAPALRGPNALTALLM